MRHARACSLVVILLGLASLLAGCGADGDAGPRSTASPARQDEVAERGAEVMPFDLDATTHTFTAIDDGGLQVVEADDPADAEQVALIRAHLQEERDRFTRGDLDDPAAIHGLDMPGLDAVAAGHEAITITYAERAAGAELRYVTDDPVLVEAIHDWFDAQVMDHGTHAHAG